jgi:hypothetical protein
MCNSLIFNHLKNIYKKPLLYQKIIVNCVEHTLTKNLLFMGYYNRLKRKYGDSWSKSHASSYWYDDYNKSFDYYDKYVGWGESADRAVSLKKSVNLYKLASVRRAIANFVQIVTGKPIPVTFKTKSDSYTDGDTVVLSGDVDENFDVSVGLALHEGSHIILSDFKMLKAFSDFMKLQVNYDSITDAALDNVLKTPTFSKYREFFIDIFSTKGKIRSKITLTQDVVNMILNLNNWIEDRRIDNYIYTSAPGYRNYYVSMYDHYFNDKIVTKGIDSDEFTDESVESYFFRIINVLNEKTDLNKLAGLRKIAELLNLKNVQRLKSTNDSMALAIEVMSVILSYTGENMQSTSTGAQPQKATGKGDGDDDGEAIEIDDIDEMEITMGGAPSAGGKKVKLSAKALEQLKKKIKKQEEFLKGDIKKKAITKNELQQLDNIDESGTELKRVGMDYKSGWRITKGVDCIVVKQLNDKTILDESFPLDVISYGSDFSRRYDNDVADGIRLGTLLGKKLQIRAESRETVFNRLKTGKIDKRMISSLGYENESVFYNTHIDQFKRVNLHISVDYSGSMSGSKIKKTITSVVAIAKACLMARNISVQVSIRSTGGSPALPWICTIYDSRKDSFKKLCKYISSIEPNGTTPEGLCFEAIQKYLIPKTNDTDSYFLNFSDGQPAFSISSGDNVIEYSGQNAAEHTIKQIKRMHDEGIQVLSYFISECSEDRMMGSSDWVIFKQSYGTSAKVVNVTNMLQIAKTINEMFLKK